MAKESKKFLKKERNISELIERLEKAGIITKSTYSLPLKDTIGRTFRDKTQFNKGIK